MKAENSPLNFRKFPQHWDVMPFNKAFMDKTGGNPKIKRNQYRELGSLPIIDQGQEYIGGYIDDLDFKCKAPIPCILFGDHTKVIKYIDFPFALGADGVKVLVPDEKLNGRFSYHYLNQLRLPDDAGYSRHFKYLKESYIPIPPIEEQKRIAAILDKADAICRKRRQAIQLADEFLRSVFLDMFGDPVTNPRGFNSPTLGDLVDIISGGTPSRAEKRYWNGMFPWVSPKDMKCITIRNPIEKISEDVFSETSLKKIPKKSILIVIRGMILAHTLPIAITAKEVAINQDIKALKACDSILPEFLLWSLLVQHNFILSKVSTAAHGTKRLDTDDLQQIKVPLPGIELQSRFIEIANKFSKIDDQTSFSFKEAETLFYSLVQKAFRGEL